MRTYSGFKNLLHAKLAIKNYIPTGMLCFSALLMLFKGGTGIRMKDEG